MKGNTTVTKQLLLSLLIATTTLTAQAQQATTTNATTTETKPDTKKAVKKTDVNATKTEVKPAEVVAPKTEVAPATTEKTAQATPTAEGDIDDEITNARMRSTLGSKSKWSFKSSLSYQGSSIEKPFDTTKLSIQGAQFGKQMTYLGGNVGVNYRLSKAESLSFGTGVQINAPLEGDIWDDFDDPRSSTGGKMKRFEVSSPYLTYSNAYNYKGIQMITSVGYTHYTTKDAVSESAGQNMLGNINFDQTILGQVLVEGLEVGASFYADYNIFKGSSYTPAIAGERYQYMIAVYPFLEYAFNDTFSFRTVFGYFQFYNMDGATKELDQADPYQSMGIGISVTRDIYLYPNIQFNPQNIRSELTNVGLSMNLNLF